MKLFHWSICCALALALAGCGDSKKPANQAVTKVALPATPEGTAEAIQKATAEGDLEVYWQALPAKHQTDVKDVLKLAGDKLDAEVYNKTMTVAGKLVTVAKAKQDFILNYPMVKGQIPDQAAAKETMTAVLNLLDTIVNSDIKTVDGLKTVDPEQFLANIGTSLHETFDKVSQIAKQPNPLETVKNAKITLVKSESDTATIKTEVEGQPSQESAWIKIDGKWVPSAMIEGWDKSIADAKEGLNNYKIASEDKTKFLDGLTKLDEVLTTFADAKNQAEFDAAVAAAGEKLRDVSPPNLPGGLGLPFGGPGAGFGPGDGPGPPPDFGAPPPDFGNPPSSTDSPIDGK